MTHARGRRRCSCTLTLFVVLMCVAQTVSYGADEKARRVLLKHTSSQNTLRVLTAQENRETVFKKEPDYGGRVVYGALPFGNGPNPFMGYAYLPSAGTLYLDKNWNLDVTDDGTISASGRSWGERYFSGIQVALPHGTGAIPYRLDLSFRGAECTVMLNSGWEGSAQIRGKRWHITVVDNLDGVIDWQDTFSLRTEEEHEQYADHGWRDPCASSAPKQLFLEGRSFDVGFSFDQGNLLMNLTKASVEVGTLQLAGDGMHRLVLEDPTQSGTVLLLQPKSACEVPVGTYDVRHVFLEDSAYSGTNMTWGQPQGPVLERVASVTASETTELLVGGPLTSKITAERRGELLQLDHAFVGLGGEAYRPQQGWNFPPPEFAIFKNCEAVAVGHFRYG